MPVGEILGKGLIYLPQYEYEAILCKEVLTRFIRQEGLELIGYHDLSAESHVAEVTVKADLKKELFEHKLKRVCNQAEWQIHNSKLKHRYEFSAGTLMTQISGKAS